MIRETYQEAAERIAQQRERRAADKRAARIEAAADRIVDAWIATVEAAALLGVER